VDEVLSLFVEAWFFTPASATEERLRPSPSFAQQRRYHGKPGTRWSLPNYPRSSQRTSLMELAR